MFALLLASTSCSDASQFVAGSSRGQSSEKPAPAKGGADSGDAQGAKADQDAVPEEYATAVPPLVITGAYLVCENLGKNQNNNADDQMPSGMEASGNNIVGCGVYGEGNIKREEKVEVMSVSASFDSGPDQKLDSVDAAGASRWHFYVIDTVSAEEDIALVSLNLNLKISGKEVDLVSAPYTPPQFHLLFVTENKYTPGTDGENGFNGLDGADAICQKLGSNSPIKARRWKALLGDASNPIEKRIELKAEVLNGELDRLWAAGADIFTTEPEVKMEYTESGKKIENDAQPVWTSGYSVQLDSALPDLLNIIRSCSNWTSNAPIQQGMAGDANSRRNWLNDGNQNCNSANRLYCISDW